MSEEQISNTTQNEIISAFVNLLQNRVLDAVSLVRPFKAAQDVAGVSLMGKTASGPVYVLHGEQSKV